MGRTDVQYERTRGDVDRVAASTRSRATPRRAVVRARDSRGSVGKKFMRGLTAMRVARETRVARERAGEGKRTRSRAHSSDRRRARVKASERPNVDADASAAIIEATSTHPVSQTTSYSFARSGFSAECERALNAQINVEYNVSYIYHAMWAFFERDNVALKGFADHFKAEALEERSHAEQLMEYVNLRGGRVELQQLLPPQTEYDHPEKGCALYALELSLSLEKLNNDKLCELHRVAEDAGDAHMCDFLEGALMDPQVQSVREVAEMVATLLRMGPPGDGMAAWHFDQYLQNKA